MFCLFFIEKMASSSNLDHESNDLYQNWVQYLSLQNLNWPDGIIGDNLKKLCSEKSNLEFMSLYNKFSITVFGKSSSLRLKLFLMISHSLDLLPTHQFGDTKEIIDGLFIPNTPSYLFFEKYHVKQYERIVKKDNLIDFYLKKNDPGFLENENMVPIFPKSMIAFILFFNLNTDDNIQNDSKSFKDNTEKNCVLSDYEKAQYYVMSSVDMHEKTDFILLDNALEGVKFGKFTIKKCFFINDYYNNQHKKENEIEKSDSSEKMDICLFIQQYAIKRKNKFIQNMIQKDEKTKTCHNIIQSFFEIGKLLEYNSTSEVPDIILNNCLKMNIHASEEIRKSELLHNSVILKQDIQQEIKSNCNEEDQCNQIKFLYPCHYIYKFLISHLDDEGKLMTNIFETTQYLLKIDKSAAFSFLFAMFSNFNDGFSWCIFYESVNHNERYFDNYFENLKEQQKKIADLSSSSSEKSNLNE